MPELPPPSVWPEFAEWDLLLCGPMLRRVTETSVCVFLALKAPRVVDLRVVADLDRPTGPPLAIARGETVPLGRHLHVLALEARLPGDRRWELGRTYGYDLCFFAPEGGDFASEGGDRESLGQPAIAPEDDCGQTLADLGLLSGPLPLGYRVGRLPSFALPARLGDLNLLHGSCRKPHGEGPDLLAEVDEQLADAWAAGPETAAQCRPHLLVLTGDQIYADDVALCLTAAIRRRVPEVLGWREWLPDGSGQRRSPDDPDLVPGLARGNFAIEQAAFTSKALDAHLMSLGEFYVMYLLQGSPALWPRDAAGRPTVPTTEETLAQCDLARDRETLRQVKARRLRLIAETEPATPERTAAERKKLADFVAVLPQVRRALANVPTLAIFDDHEITDDWNLNRRWVAATRRSPAGRRILRNGLLAYCLFQDWGNHPERYAPGTFGGIVLAGLSAGKFPGNLARSAVDASASPLQVVNPKVLSHPSAARNPSGSQPSGSQPSESQNSESQNSESQNSESQNSDLQNSDLQPSGSNFLERELSTQNLERSSFLSSDSNPNPNPSPNPNSNSEPAPDPNSEIPIRESADRKFLNLKASGSRASGSSSGSELDGMLGFAKLNPTYGIASNFSERAIPERAIPERESSLGEPSDVKPAALDSPDFDRLALNFADLDFAHPNFADRLDALLPLLDLGDDPDRHEPPHRRLHWHWCLQWATLGFQVVGLDARTWRHFPDPDPAADPPVTDEASIGSIAPEALPVQLQAARRDLLTAIVSSTPVFGLPLVEFLQQIIVVERKGPAAGDNEPWSGNKAARQAFLQALLDWERVIFLSGDVHYGFTNHTAYFERSPSGPSRRGRFVQLCASSLKNTEIKQRVLATIPFRYNPILLPSLEEQVVVGFEGLPEGDRAGRLQAAADRYCQEASASGALGVALGAALGLLLAEGAIAGLAVGAVAGLLAMGSRLMLIPYVSRAAREVAIAPGTVALTQWPTDELAAAAASFTPDADFGYRTHFSRNAAWWRPCPAIVGDNNLGWVTVQVDDGEQPVAITHALYHRVPRSLWRRLRRDPALDRGDRSPTIHEAPLTLPTDSERPDCPAGQR